MYHVRYFARSSVNCRLLVWFEHFTAADDFCSNLLSFRHFTCDFCGRIAGGASISASTDAMPASKRQRDVNSKTSEKLVRMAAAGQEKELRPSAAAAAAASISASRGASPRAMDVSPKPANGLLQPLSRRVSPAVSPRELPAGFDPGLNIDPSLHGAPAAGPPSTESPVSVHALK